MALHEIFPNDSPDYKTAREHPVFSQLAFIRGEIAVGLTVEEALTVRVWAVC